MGLDIRFRYIAKPASFEVSYPVETPAAVEKLDFISEVEPTETEKMIRDEEELEALAYDDPLAYEQRIIDSMLKE